MTEFTRRDMRQHVRDGFIVLLPETVVVGVFGGNLKLPRIAKASQDHRRTRPILNLTEKSDEGTPNVDDTIEREVVPESM